jgi:spore maturation protein CgeB
VRVVIFCHSLVSDWNHGNAHFLRGIVQELVDRNCAVRVFEPQDGWSRTNLLRDHGNVAIHAFHRAYPRLHSDTYDLASLDLNDAIGDADLVMVHEWTDRHLVARIGRHRADSGAYVLFFHDTHHRSATEPASMSAYDLSHYDGVLAFGDVVRETYLRRGWAQRVWTWHEAADMRVFYPRSRPAHVEPDEHPAERCDATARFDNQHEGESCCLQVGSGFSGSFDSSTLGGDVVWIGNWGDEERTSELEEFLFAPVTRLGLRATVFGVRYPEAALERLAAAGIDYRGWLPNHQVPEVFARFTATIHIPRRPYLESLPGIPTIRPFEALACGIPLVSARWHHSAGLFAPGEDFLVARDGDEMTAHLSSLMTDATLRARLAARGLATVMARHTCAQRVDELMAIYEQVRTPRRIPGVSADGGLVDLGAAVST